jgi:hypothetical protein
MGLLPSLNWWLGLALQEGRRFAPALALIHHGFEAAKAGLFRLFNFAQTT